MAPQRRLNARTVVLFFLALLFFLGANLIAGVIVVSDAFEADFGVLAPLCYAFILPCVVLGPIGFFVVPPIEAALTVFVINAMRKRRHNNFQYSIRTLLIAVAIFALITFGVVSSVHRYYGRWDDWVPAYPVVSYMENHAGQWPPNWEALRTEIEERASVDGWSFEKYRACVTINFDVDPADLRRQVLASDKPTFDVIQVTDVTGRPQGNLANQMIYNYIRSKAEDSGSSP